MSPTSNPTPEDAETATIAWLKTLRRAAVEFKATDAPPFTLVRCIAGEEQESSGSYVISVRTLAARSAGVAAAAQAAEATHARMLLWSRTLEPVTVGSRSVAPDYVRVFQSPLWIPFDDDQILCKLARYDIGLSFTL